MQGTWSTIHSDALPATRCGHTLTLVSSHDKQALILAFGEKGKDSKAGDRTFLDSVHRFFSGGSATSWSLIESKASFVPTARADHSASAFHGHVLFFGGRFQSEFLDTTFILANALSDQPQWVPIYCATNPAGRRGHTVTLVSPPGDKSVAPMFLFGGQRGSAFLNDAHLFDPERLEWRAVKTSGPAPAARAFHACFSPSRACAVVLGGVGSGSGAGLDDTAELCDLREGRWAKLTLKDMPVFQDYQNCHWLPESQELLLFNSQFAGPVASAAAAAAVKAPAVAAGGGAGAAGAASAAAGVVRSASLSESKAKPGAAGAAGAASTPSPDPAVTLVNFGDRSSLPAGRATPVSPCVSLRF
jgi:hypothetical protein